MDPEEKADHMAAHPEFYTPDRVLVGKDLMRPDVFSITHQMETLWLSEAAREHLIMLLQH